MRLSRASTIRERPPSLLGKQAENHHRNITFFPAVSEKHAKLRCRLNSEAFISVVGVAVTSMWDGLALLDCGYLNKADACSKYELKLCREHFTNRWILGQMDQPATFPVTTCHGALDSSKCQNTSLTASFREKKLATPEPSHSRGGERDELIYTAVSCNLRRRRIRGNSRKKWESNREERLVMSDS